MTATMVKLLFDICGRCGNEVVGDNMGTGRPWQHVAVPDDHPIVFGTPAPPAILKPATLDDLEHVLEPVFPPPGTPRPVAADETPTGARRMMKVGRDNGFEVVARLCTGPIKMAPHHDPRGFRYVDSLLVGFRHPDGRVAVGIWERQETEEAYSYQWAMFPDGGGLAGSAALKDYLRR